MRDKTYSAVCNPVPGESQMQNPRDFFQEIEEKGMLESFGLYSENPIGKYVIISQEVFLHLQSIVAAACS